LSAFSDAILTCFSASPPRENKLLAVPRGITLPALRRRLSETLSEHAGLPALRYRLPGETAEAEAMVELASEEDLALMVEEYDSLQACNPRGGPASRLHVYVSSRAAPAPAPPLPSPRSVLRRWRSAAAAGGRQRKAGASSGSGSGSEGRAAADVACLRLPASLTGDDAAAGLASMRALAEAVVADVCGPVGGLACWASPAYATSSPGVRGVQLISAEDMELGPKLGDGSYAVVHAGWWRGATVAVKILRAPRPGPDDAAGAQRAAAAFTREAGLLARLQHPNVLALYGVVAPGAGPPAAVLELMPHGSLRAALRSRTRAPDRRTAACLALGAARAMQHLHAQSPPVVHFDLKADNLLVDWRDAATPVCKLADLGLAASVAGSDCASVAGRGTLWWMAPELYPGVATSAPVDVRVDVFSFGVVMHEICAAGADPYAQGTPTEALMAAVRAGVRPATPRGVDAAWTALMHACWAADAASRPTFAEIVPILARMAQAPL
jgi:hypothetical protein